jgi:prepilin-type N-terminal cleavage/methylation domain-containing protein
MRQKGLKKAHRGQRSRQGFSLIETVIAVLLISVVVTSVFSVTLTAKTAGKKTERRAEGLAYVRQVHEKVKGYIREANTAGINDPLGGTFWNLPEDACNGGAGNCPANCYALDLCTHDVSSVLPAVCSENVGLCRAAPVNGQVTYTVTQPGGVGNPRRVTFDIRWDE